MMNLIVRVQGRSAWEFFIAVGLSMIILQFYDLSSLRNSSVAYLKVVQNTLRKETLSQLFIYRKSKL